MEWTLWQSKGVYQEKDEYIDLYMSMDYCYPGIGLYSIYKGDPSDKGRDKYLLPLLDTPPPPCDFP